MFKIVNKNTMFAIILLVIPLGGVGIDLYSASLPILAKYLNVNQSQIKFTLSFYLVGLAIGMFFSGILSDIFGRRPLQLVNSILFIFACISITFAHSLAIILMLRLLQGISAGGVQVVGRSSLTDIFSKMELAKKTVYVTTVWGVGPIIAPWIGGELTHNFGWEACFYFFAIYGIIIFIAYLYSSETYNTRNRFCFIRLRSDILWIITHSNFFIPMIMMSLGYTIFLVYGICGPYFIEIVLGKSPIYYGNVGFILGFGYLIGTLICRILINKYKLDDILRVAVIGMFLINLINLILSSFIGFSLILIIENIVLTCFAVGFTYPIYMVRSLNDFATKAGVASAITTLTITSIAALISFILSFINVNTIVEFLGIYFTISLIILLFWKLSTIRKINT